MLINVMYYQIESVTKSEAKFTSQIFSCKFRHDAVIYEFLGTIPAKVGF